MLASSAKQKEPGTKRSRAGVDAGAESYFFGVAGAGDAESFAAGALLLFFVCFLLVFAFAVAAGCWSAGADWFRAFLAVCGAAIRKGPAATVSSVDVNSFFISFSPSTFVAAWRSLGFRRAGSNVLAPIGLVFFCFAGSPCRSQLHFAGFAPFP